MKQALLFFAALALFVAAGSRAQAQTTGNVTLNVTLVDIVTLTVNANNTVDFNLNSASSYAANQTQTQTSQLTITANRPFDLAVKSNNANLAFGANTIPLNVVKIESTNANLGSATLTQATLSATNQTIIDEAPAAVARNIDLKYTLLTNTNLTDFNKPAGTYTTQLEYTASID